MILPAVSISTRHTVIPALLAARMARLTSDFRNVDAALDIASGFSSLFALAVFLILTGERGVIKGQRLHHRGRWELIEGIWLEEAIERQFADPCARYLHVHFAAPGCYAAEVERA